jgi:hypothetical protein
LNKPGTSFHVCEIREGTGRKEYNHLPDVGGSQWNLYPNCKSNPDSSMGKSVEYEIK